MWGGCAGGVGRVRGDRSARDSPAGWAGRALRAFDEWGAERIVAERNFGGALVESTLRSVRAQAPVRLVTAPRGKAARAEPVAALYELGRVIHHGRFTALEDQLCHFSVSGYRGSRSPDRADAMVWGLSDLMLNGTGGVASWNSAGFSFAR